jgi:hypothetical protein
MRETRTYGSVRGARGNSRPYRKPGPVADILGNAVQGAAIGTGPYRLKSSMNLVVPVAALRWC